VLAFIAHGFYFMLVNQLFYAKKTRNLPAYTLIAASVNIVLNVLTLEQFGIMAAAWNTVVGYSILTILVYFESKRVYPVPYEFRRILLALLAFGITYLISNQINLANPYLNVIARSLTMLAFPVLLLALRFFTPQEIQGMKSLPMRLQKRLSAQRSG
jgi:O-antigen/teichoic acid export membrane protein